MALSQTTRSKQGQLAILRRRRPDDTAAITQAETEFRTERLADYIRDTVDAAPPLTPEQRDRLALLLRGGGDDAA